MESLLSFIHRIREFLPPSILPRTCSIFKLLRITVQPSPTNRGGEGFLAESSNSTRWNAGVTVSQKKLVVFTGVKEKGFWQARFLHSV